MTNERNKQIRKARETLRVLHDKYKKEFTDINVKIDKYLEGLQEEEKETEKRSWSWSLIFAFIVALIGGVIWFRLWELLY